MEENSMEPSERLKALTARANDFPFDNKISLKRFVRTTKEMERMVRDDSALLFFIYIFGFYIYFLPPPPHPPHLLLTHKTPKLTS